MKPSMPLCLLLLAAAAACVAPTASPSLTQLNQRWAGQPWTAYQEAHGKPTHLAAQPEGGLVATYLRSTSRMVSSPRGTTYAVNPRTGERAVVHPGSSPDVAGQQVSSGGHRAVITGSEGGTTIAHGRCTTMVHVDTQGRVQKIEQHGDDCR